PDERALASEDPGPRGHTTTHGPHDDWKVFQCRGSTPSGWHCSASTAGARALNHPVQPIDRIPECALDIGLPHGGYLHLPAVRAGALQGTLPCRGESLDVGRDAGGRLLVGVWTSEQEHWHATLLCSNPVLHQPQSVKSVPLIPVGLSRAADS